MPAPTTLSDVQRWLEALWVTRHKDPRFIAARECIYQLTEPWERADGAHSDAATAFTESARTFGAARENVIVLLERVRARREKAAGIIRTVGYAALVLAGCSA